MRILIVEDEKISQKKMEIIMSKFGFCDLTSSGDTAIEMYKKSWEQKAPYDIVTLDITLDGTDGLETLVTIREFEKENKVPPEQWAKIIMVTSQNNQDAVYTSMTAGSNGYVVKPFSNDTIESCLKDIFTRYARDSF